MCVLSSSASKREAATALGASFLVASDPNALASHANSFDVIVSTVSADYDVNPFFRLLKVEGSYCLVGLPPGGVHVNPFKVSA